jgi:hypothetical protein
MEPRNPSLPEVRSTADIALAHETLLFIEVSSFLFFFFFFFPFFPLFVAEASAIILVLSQVTNRSC